MACQANDYVISDRNPDPHNLSDATLHLKKRCSVRISMTDKGVSSDGPPLWIFVVSSDYLIGAIIRDFVGENKP